MTMPLIRTLITSLMKWVWIALIIGYTKRTEAQVTIDENDYLMNQNTNEEHESWFKQFHEELQMLKRENQEQDKTLALLNKKLTTYEDMLDIMRRNVSECDQNLMILKEENREQENKIQKLQINSAAQTEQLIILQTNCSCANGANIDRNETTTSLSIDTDYDIQNITSIKDELETIKIRIQRHEDELLKLEENNTLQQEHINELKYANASIQTKVLQNQQAIARISPLPVSLLQDINLLKSANVSVQAWIVQNRQSIATVTATNSAQQLDINLLKSANINIQSKANLSQQAIANMQNRVNSLQATRSHGGLAFIRWGRRVCPSNSTKIYSGYAAGNKHSTKGGGNGYLCLPDIPQWGSFLRGHQPGSSSVYGVEYETSSSNSPFLLTNNGGSQLANTNSPCSLCHSTIKSTTVTIPARRDCPTGWNLEYRGYLVTEGESSYRNDYVCLDEAPEAVAGSFRNDNEALFYPVESACGSLPCGAYETGREIACVVCSR